MDGFRFGTDRTQGNAVSEVVSGLKSHKILECFEIGQLMASRGGLRSTTGFEPMRNFRVAGWLVVVGDSEGKRGIASQAELDKSELAHLAPCTIVSSTVNILAFSFILFDGTKLEPLETAHIVNRGDSFSISPFFFKKKQRWLPTPLRDAAALEVCLSTSKLPACPARTKRLNSGTCSLSLLP